MLCYLSTAAFGAHEHYDGSKEEDTKPNTTKNLTNYNHSVF